MLEQALDSARAEAAELREARQKAAEQRTIDDTAQMSALQVGSGLWWAAAALPFLQVAYFAVRLLLWLADVLEWLGVL